MAVDDVYRVKATLEGIEGEWSITWHYQELTPSSIGISTKQLAESVAEHLTPELVALLSNEHQVSRFTVDKLSGTRFPNSTFSLVDSARRGAQIGPALPASSAIQFKLGQTFFPSTSNGQFWLSGVPRVQATGSVLVALYANGVVSDFAVKLFANVPEVSAGDGLWRIVVLSRKHLDANPGDYVGAAADVTLVGFDTRLGRMRSRGFGGRRKKKTIEV